MYTFLATPARKLSASVASTALIIGIMVPMSPSANAQTESGDVVQVASAVYENPNFAPGVLSVSNDQWKDTRVDCRLITETADFYTTMSQANSWLDVNNVGDCTVVSTAPTRSGNPALYALSTGQYVALTRKSNNETLTIRWGDAPIVPRLTVSDASISGVVDEVIVPVTVTAANFTPNLFTISPQPPSGLTFDSGTGLLSGSPESSQQATSYTITGSDGNQEASVSVSIRILAEPPLTVTFKQDVGMLSRSLSVESGQSILLPKTQNAQGQEGVTLSGGGSALFPIVKDSHLFGGWYSDSGFSDNSFVGFPGDSFTPLASTELYAKWIPARDICFRQASSTINGEVTFPAAWVTQWTMGYPTRTCTNGTQARVPSDKDFDLPVPSRANAGFHGWYSQAQATNSSSTSGTLRGQGGAVHQVTFSSGSVLTYHSQWQTSSFRINFDPNLFGSSFGAEPCEVVGFTSWCGIRWNPGDSIGSDGRAAVVAPTPTREGWEFKGWFTSSSGGTRLGGGGDLISGAANDTVRAQWTKLAVPAIVTFDVGDDAGTAPSPMSATVGSNITLPRPTREDYAFRGWFSQATGGTRAGGADRNYTVTGDVTLYARWLDARVRPQPRPQPPVSLPKDDTAVIVDEGGNESQVTITRPARPNNEPPSQIQIERTQGQGEPDLTMSLEGVNRDGEAVELSPDGLLVLSEDRLVAAAGSGFLPSAPVAFYLTPPAVQAVSMARVLRLAPASTDSFLVGTVTVDDTGNFDDTLVLPEGMSGGDYLLEAVGPTSTGETLSIILGVRVEVSTTDETPDPAIPASAPVNVRATAGDASARVTWSPPADTGDFPVTMYQVVGAPSGGCLVQAPARSCVITGLTNGEEYTFTVRALTGAGWSPYSDASAPVTPQAQAGRPALPTPEPEAPVEPVSPGDSIATENGQPVPVTVDTNTQGTGLSIVGDGFDMNLDGVDSRGTPIGLSADGVLLLTDDRRVAAQGTGFAPGAPIAFYLYPPTGQSVAGGDVRMMLRAAGEPILLDTVTVDNAGSFTGTLILPPGMASGDYLVQAVGEAMSGVVRSVTLGVRVEASASILITGSRAEVRGREGVQVRGVTTGLEGVVVTPRIRLGKEESYSNGVGLRTVGTDGVFEWERITSRWVYVYFRADDVRSNRIVIRRD